MKVYKMSPTAKMTFPRASQNSDSPYHLTANTLMSLNFSVSIHIANSKIAGYNLKRDKHGLEDKEIVAGSDAKGFIDEAASKADEG
ncbi:MAG: hypothetical protein Q9198_008618 [Flavoplaca austrocitrina]